ncbi:unnamed protein product, partial [Didymodactylos carnosus]
LGLNFIPTTGINTTKYVTRVIAGIESDLYKNDSIQKEQIVSDVRNTLDRHLNRAILTDKKNRNVKKEQEGALKSLKVDDSILVISADKGGKIVAMNTSDYKAKIEEKLSNSSTYTKLSENPTKRSSKELVEDLNNKTTNLKFIFEFEKNNQLPFLDVLIAIDKVNKKFTTSWFRKETASNYLLNFHSNHNSAIKNNIVKNMTNRVLVANNGHKNEKHLNDLQKILENSQFPKNIKNKIKKKNSSEIENSSSEDADEEDLVDNCWGNETDNQGHYSEDNLSNEDDDEYVLSRDLSQTQRATFLWYPGV